MPKLKRVQATIYQVLLPSDIVVCILGLVFTSALTIWLAVTIGHPIFIVVGIIGFLVCAAYLVMRKYLSHAFLLFLLSVKVMYLLIQIESLV